MAMRRFTGFDVGEPDEIAAAALEHRGGRRRLGRPVRYAQPRRGPVATGAPVPRRHRVVPPEPARPERHDHDAHGREARADDRHVELDEAPGTGLSAIPCFS